MHPADEIPALTPEQCDAWLGRMGIGRPPVPTLQAMNSLIAAHLARFPFENLDSLLGRRVRIGPPFVFEKLLRRRRGGYCFELNTLFCAGLKSLGYTVVPLAARVRWHVQEGTPTSLSHMLLRVEVENQSYIVDVGFGGPTPDHALVLSPRIEHASAAAYQLRPTPQDARAIHLPSYDLTLHSLASLRGRTDGGSEDTSGQVLYRFDLSPQPQIDFEMRNWDVSTNPDSHFTQALMVARTDDTGVRISLANAKLTEREPDGSVRSTNTLPSVDSVIDVLTERFGIELDGNLRESLTARWPSIMVVR